MLPYNGIKSNSEEETKNWAFDFAKKLKTGDVVALTGDLGAGKTAICKAICYALGFRGTVNSPSYAIVHEYPGNPPIYHLDLYRLDDISDLGIEDFSNGITLIEWPKNFNLNITYRIDIKIIGENEREIRIENGE